MSHTIATINSLETVPALTRKDPFDFAAVFAALRRGQTARQGAISSHGVRAGNARVAPLGLDGPASPDKASAEQGGQ